GALTVIIIMRDDFYSRLIESAPALSAWLERGLKNVPLRISRTELLELITKPATQLGWRFEPARPPRVPCRSNVGRFPIRPCRGWYCGQHRFTGSRIYVQRVMANTCRRCNDQQKPERDRRFEW